ncbi:MAG: pyridoxal phosphate-dependent aminotransferase [Bacteroidota bacterium]
MNPLSQRVINMNESATIAMAQKGKDLRAKGVDVISLSLGEPDFKTPKHIQEAAITAINSEKYFSYPPVPGYPDLREAIAKKFREENNIDCTATNIVVSNGAKHSIANVMMAMLNPGDEVLVLSPYWVSYADLVEVAEGTPVYVKGTFENKFKATADQIEAAITDKTKLMIYSSPCNPSGEAFTMEETEAIVKVVEKYPNLYVISDEIYEYINFVGEHISIGSYPSVQDRIITINGVSKAYAMTGWRVGYMCANEVIAKACNKIQGQFTSGINGIAQRAALSALQEDFGPTQEMVNEYGERRKLVYDLLAEIPGLKTLMPSGAFYFFPDVSSYFGKSYNGRAIDNASDLSMYLLEEAHVSVVTGDAFGIPECVRLSYAASREDLVEAIKRIKDSLSKLS